MKTKIRFKDPDAIYEIIKAKHPLPANECDITPRIEKSRNAFSAKYFEYGDYADYGMIEVDTDTMAARLLPRSEWK